ncbi:polyprenyl synthetase family protein [Patescibacteria group bacterium]|nr:polyprenyl synthetase family protein [Patescibacteria group bacterium]
MKVGEDLKNFKKIFDQELERFLDAKAGEAKKISPVALAATANLKNYILRSGKRIRPALMYHTYLALGGKNKKEAMRAAMAPEMLHTFLIIHDDVIDRDNLRRGKPSVHYFYRKSAGKKCRNFSDAIHYGNSQAICVGDMAFSFANEIIAESKLEGSVKDGLFKKIGNIVFNTVIGEFYDGFAALEKNISEKDVLTILEYKTAKYTVEGPIHLGAIAAGATEPVLKKLSGFAVPLGIAYQVQDDILGVFGSSEKTGKPVGADIKEGKKTLLVVKALEFSNVRQRKEIISALGNPRINKKQIDNVRDIISKTGSLEYSKNLAEKLTARSLQSLEKSALSRESKEFFSQVADFIIKRDY